MSGYWENPKATAETLVDGWLHTGDIGHVDPDNGYLYLTDRASDSSTSSAVDLDHDYFIFAAGPPERLRDDSGGVPTWRAKVSAQLADKPFGGIQLDVSPQDS
ncbi:hypothetical protein [Amycolatopsis panacis]|uniref:hypothetical protein n=1 Tax=Amycolatopsis panacis TaxID=2340917 RepID=UPI0026CBEBFB|nr:hypothetical protein [Amycolatopsis panacis]